MGIHCSGSCFIVVLLHLASAPGGLSVCALGAVSVAGKDTVLCLSVCLAVLDVQGLVGLCWVQTEQQPGTGRGAQQLQGSSCCRSCCAKSKSTCTGRGSGTAQGCSSPHRLKSVCSLQASKLEKQSSVSESDYDNPTTPVELEEPG